MIDDLKKMRSKRDALTKKRDELAAAVRAGDGKKRQALRETSAQIVALSKEMTSARRDAEAIIAETQTGKANGAG